MNETIAAIFIQSGKRNGGQILRGYYKECYQSGYIDFPRMKPIRQLCKEYGETIRYDLVDEQTREQLLLGTSCRNPLINPVNFRTWHKRLAKRLHHLVSTHQIRIDQNKFPLTTMSLRTCINKPGDIWDIDKQQTSHSDVFDALRMYTLCLRSGN